MLDEEIKRRKPEEGPHRQVVGAAVMDSELLLKVIQRGERVGSIKAFLVFPVTSFDLSVMSGRVRTNVFMLNAQLSSGFLEKGLDIPFTVRKMVSKFKTVVGLDTFHMDTSSGIPFHQPFQEVCGGAGGLLGISGQEAELGKLINGGILKLRVCNTLSGDNLDFPLKPPDLSRYDEVLYD